MSGKEWLDVSRKLRPGMPVWPGDPPVTTAPVSRIENGQVSNVTLWTFPSHVGTHVDPPRHFIHDGGSVESMLPGILCGPAYVLDLREQTSHVSADTLAARFPSGVSRLLLHTANSHADPDVFHEDYIALTPDASRWLVQAGIPLIGVDGPSIEPFDTESFDVHHTVLGAGIAVIENLALAGIEEGSYEMICAPILLEDGDGAPARVFLRPDPNL